MNNSFSHIQDHLTKIYENFNTLYPEKFKAGQLSISLTNDTHLAFEVSFAPDNLSNRTLTTNLFSLSDPVNSIITIEQKNLDRITGKLKIWTGANKKHVSEDDAKKIFDKYDLENFILKKTAKLKMVLNHDFVKDFPERTVFKALNQTSVIIVQIKDKYQVEVNFTPLYMNDKNEIKGIYDWRDFKNICALFKPEQASAFSEIGKKEAVSSAFDNFNQLLGNVSPEMFIDKLKKSLILFKTDMAEINQFFYKHENKKKVF